MQMNNVVYELHRIATDLEREYSRIADSKIEIQLEELKKEFLKNVKNNPALKIDGETVWNKIKESIRQDMRKRPQDWRT